MNTKNETKKTVVNVENTKAAIEEARELSVNEKLSAFQANHAVEHYCAAVGGGITEDEVRAELAKCLHEVEGVSMYWVFTCPSIGTENSRGEVVTQEMWERSNPDAIRCDILDRAQWYKKAVTLSDLFAVRRVLSSLKNYEQAKEKGAVRYIAKLEDELVQAATGGDMAKVAELASKINELKKQYNIK